MNTTADLDALLTAIREHLIAAVVVQDCRSEDAVLKAVGITGDGITRGAIKFAAMVSNCAEHESAGFAFAFAFALGERDALQRAAVAVTTPVAARRPAELLRLLADGLSIDAALARLAAAEKAAASEQGEKVVPLRRGEP